MEKYQEIDREIYDVSYVDVSTGETIAYRKAGDRGPTFLLIHGNTSSSVWFEEFMEELSEDHIVYALDLPGFGDSTYNRVQKSLYDISRDVSDFILKLGLKDVYLLGWSTGGGVALETAATIPDKIERVILLSSLGIKGYPMYKRDIFSPFSTEIIRTREDMFRYNALVAPVLSTIKNSNRYVVREMMDRYIYHIKRPDNYIIERNIDGTMKQRNYVDILTSIANFNITDEFVDGIKGSGRYKLVKAYVHVIHGDRDLICDVNSAIYTSKYFGLQSDLKIFRGCGHSIMTDDFDGLVDYVKSLVNSRIDM